MKILIFGLPRSGTTFLQSLLSRALNIKNYSEEICSPFIVNKKDTDLYEWVRVLDHGIFKVLSIGLDQFDIIKMINIGNFDSVIVTQRKNLTDSCISLFYAEQIIHQYHHKRKFKSEKIDKFVCPTEFTHEWLVQTQLYNHVLKNISNYIIFDYDKYIAGGMQIINGVKICLTNEADWDLNTVSTNLPYNELCLNYKEIEGIINENHS